MSEKEENFLHISGDKDFQKRSDSVFSSLDRLEPTRHEEDGDDPDNIRVTRGRRRRPNRVPDHVLHPEKWTKYSLEEDGTEEFSGVMPNDLNKHVARSFIAELEKRKQTGKEGTGTDASEMQDSGAVNTCQSDKHVFTKHVAESKVVPSPSSHGKQGVLMMPEYVVGQKPDKQKKKVTRDESQGSVKSQEKTVGITHLQVEQDEVEEEEISTTTLTTGENQRDSENKEVSNDTGEDKVTFVKRKHKERKGLRKHVKADNDD
ncbi:predicted protein [Nematostella vectensis]|uniref:U5 small nuclear ribonucleoprotein TSSC4 n=1 Tax=Nematostella vectensis TaxID=45351 RepID=A7RVI2_NEMVE|nr:predicted protein [Nematostella vectensis]|eukprot:XP_001636707.1 predicted protein [Nematostella vectensis]